jgi:hypothetical protein
MFPWKLALSSLGRKCGRRSGRELRANLEVCNNLPPGPLCKSVSPRDVNSISFTLGSHRPIEALYEATGIVHLKPEHLAFDL